MTEQDVRRILAPFIHEDEIRVAKGISATIDAFLDVAGFRDIEPTREAMLQHDKGYAHLIEQGVFEE